MSLFSIVATTYEGSDSSDILQRFIDSLKAQSFKDFEVIIMHDGPRRIPVDDIDTGDLKVIWHESMFRAAVWGHNMRSYGMARLASGEFLINTNVDNVYYPEALQELAEEVTTYTDVKVFVNHVKMMGMFLKEEQVTTGFDAAGNKQTKTLRTIAYDKPRDYSKSLILTGDPPVFANIDLMSLVAHRNVWDRIYYWYDLGVSSDGVIYNKICTMFPYKNTGILLGEHY